MRDSSMTKVQLVIQLRKAMGGMTMAVTNYNAL